MYTSNGLAPPREVSLDTPPPQVIQKGKGAARLLRGLKRVIRLFVKVLYLFPLLLVAKLVLFLMGNWVGDLITVAFVVLVVLFFSLFSLFFLLYAIAGPPSRRILLPRLRLPEEGDLDGAASLAGYKTPEMTTTHALAEHCEPDAEEWESIRVRGRVVGTTDQTPGDVVLRDCWLEQDGRVARMMAGNSFAVIREGFPPVVVGLEGAIHLVVAGPYEVAGVGELDLKHLAKYEQWLQGRSSNELSVPNLAGGQCCTLTVGQEVELVGGHYGPIPNLDDFRVGGRRLGVEERRSDSIPYRGDRLTRGLRLCSNQGAPLIICKR